MTCGPLTDVATRFRRQFRLARTLRWALGIGLGGSVIALFATAPHMQRWLAAGIGAVVAVWLVLFFQAVRLLRLTRSSSALLQQGRIDEACASLLNALDRLTPLPSIKVLACHYLATAAHLSERYAEAVDICRELLAHPLGTMTSVGTATRLILADSLLMLDNVESAAAVCQDIDATRLSLADRLTLLPIELRCQLATGGDDQAVDDLSHKVRLAELLDSAGAALTHALLAEGCRRTKRDAQHAYLLRRAALLADLPPIVARYNPVLGELDIDVTAFDPLGSPDSERLS